jgi:hypothetical protein
MTRFKYWCILFLCSIIYFISVLDAISYWRSITNDEPVSARERNIELWVVVTATVSILLSFSGVLCWLLPQIETIQRIEMACIFIVVALNGVVVTFSTIKPSYKLYLADFFFVVLPNVFMFGWLCVFSGIVLLANWYWHDVQKEEGLATVQWILLASTSFVVMIAALAYRDTSLETLEAYLGNETTALNSETQSVTSICEVMEGVSCNRVYLALILGAISAATSTSIAAWKNAPQLCQSEVAFLLFIAWISGVAILTFETGPGKIIGSIYFGTWVSLVLSLDIYITTIKASTQNSRGIEIAQQATNRDDIFGVAHDRLEIQLAGWSSGSRAAASARRVRKGLSSVLFSSIEVWSGPSDRTGGNETSSPSVASPEVGITLTTTNVATATRRHKLTRLEFWIVLLLLSCVCLAALFPTLPETEDRATHEIFAIAVPSVSIGLSLLGYALCLMPQKAAKYADLVLVRSKGDLSRS